jgi:glutathione S-transferase
LLARHYPGPVELIPDDPELAAQVRSTDRFYDLHLHDPMQKVVGDKLRPADGHDPIGVGEAKERMRTTLRIADREMATRQWAIGERFSMADCAAAAPLFFTNEMMPLAEEFPHASAYLECTTLSSSTEPSPSGPSGCSRHGRAQRPSRNGSWVRAAGTRSCESWIFGSAAASR